MIRAYRFRLYPNRLQTETLNHHLWLSKELWNRILAYSKDKHKRERKFASRRELREMVKHQGLYSQVAQELVDRLVEATWRFIELKKIGEKCGFPRFKSFDRMKSLCYPQLGFRLMGKRLKVSPFGTVNIKLHRPVEGRVRTLVLSVKHLGNGLPYSQWKSAKNRHRLTMVQRSESTSACQNSLSYQMAQSL